MVLADVLQLQLVRQTYLQEVKIMALNCSSNAALDKLQASKDAMQAKLDSLVSAGASALADVKAQADAIKADLLAALPEIPELPNLKKELAELQAKLQTATGPHLAKLKSDFQNRWGDSVPDLDTMIAGVENLAKIAANPLAALNIDLGGFSLCDSVPNNDAPEIVDGKVTKIVEKAKEPTTPDDNAKQSEPIVPAIVETENKIVEGFGKSAKQIKEDYDLYKLGTWTPGTYDDWYNHTPGYYTGGLRDLLPKKSLILQKTKEELTKEIIALRKKLKNMFKKKKKDGYDKSSKYFNDGKMESKYHSDFKEYVDLYYDLDQIKRHRADTTYTLIYFELLITGELTTEDTILGGIPVGTPEAEEAIKNRFSGASGLFFKEGVYTMVTFPSDDALFEKCKKYVNENSQIILDYYNYKNAITPA